VVDSVANNKTTTQKGTLIPLFPSDCGESALEIKLKRELEARSEQFRQSFHEDVCSVLTLTDWSDDVMLRLIQTPNLLQEVVSALHDDDVFSDFFDQRVKDLILELVGNE